jgi:transposase
MVAEHALRRRFRLIEPHLNERLRRLVAAAEVAAAGAGGVSAVARATGVSRRAIRAGAKELKARGAAALAPGRIRRPGGGRKRTIDQDPTLVTDLEKLIEPTTRGDPESPLRWTCKSVRRLATELTGQGHRTSHRMVAALLPQLGYSLQGNRKTIEGTRHPDRPAQFEHIAGRVQAYLRQGQPAISVDTKKKELVGNFKNAGREWRARGQPQPVQVHDFVQPELGRAIPYGVYDLGANTGWVSVGIDHDTAAFAVASIRHWWQAMGRRASPARGACSSPPTLAGATARACGCGRSSCRNWPTTSAGRSPCATSRPARASGTRSNTACSPLSVRTGAASRWSVTPSS